MGKKNDKPEPKAEFRTVDVDSREGREAIAEMGRTIVEELKEYDKAVCAAGAVFEFLKRKFEKLQREGQGFCDAMSKLLRAQQPCRDDRNMPEMILKGTRFEIDPKDIAFRRAPKYDTKDSIAFCVTARNTSEKDGCTECVSESFILNVSQDYAASVAAFDKAVAGLEFVKFGEKHPKGPCKCPKGACGKKGCDGKDGKGVTFSKVLSSKKALDGFKRFLMESSRYAVPSTRFKVLFDSTDKKSQKFVYELRFFQKNYRKDDTQSYERALLRIRMDGDRGDLIAKRFDKAVEGLRFNEFPEKTATFRKK